MCLFCYTKRTSEPKYHISKRQIVTTMLSCNRLQKIKGHQDQWSYLLIECPKRYSYDIYLSRWRNKCHKTHNHKGPLKIIGKCEKFRNDFYLFPSQFLREE